MTPRRLARLIGALYVVLIVFGMFSPIVLDTLLVPGDAVATAERVTSSLGLFRVSLVGWIVIVAVDVVVAALFYVLLEPAGRTLSLVAAWLRVVYAGVLGAYLLGLFDAHRLLTSAPAGPGAGTDAGAGAGASAAEVQSMALHALETFDMGFLLALMIFGAHLLALGALLHRSRYVPRVLGVLLVAAGLGYILDGLGNLFVPGYGGLATAVFMTPAVLGELGLTGWLLVKGVDT